MIIPFAETCQVLVSQVVNISLQRRGMQEREGHKCHIGRRSGFPGHPGEWDGPAMSSPVACVDCWVRSVGTDRTQVYLRISDQPLTLISTGLSSSNLMWDSAGMVISFFPVAAAPPVPAPAPAAAPIAAPFPPPRIPPRSAPAAAPPPMNSALCLACPFPDSPN